MSKPTTIILAALLLALPTGLHAAERPAAQQIDRETLDKGFAPYRGWHYQPDHVMSANPQNGTFYLYDCACGSKGRGIGLITSKPLTNKEATGK